MRRSTAATRLSSNNRSAQLEHLESRQLLAATVVQAPPDVTGASTTSLSVDLSTYFDDPIQNTQVRFTTELGNVDVTMFRSQKPITVANFLDYVRQGLYDSTIIHRSVTQGISVIQGGGYGPPTFAHITELNDGIQNEAATEPVLPNSRGTISMARKDDANSATSEWFINTADNTSLNPGGPNGVGYAVFGIVTPESLPVVDAIQALPTFAFNSPFGEIPLRNYTQADFTQQPPKTPTSDNFVSVTAATIPKLTYDISSSNPAVATGSVSGNKLTLQYLTVGTSDITITASDGQGGVVTDTFTATVTDAPNFTVNLGAEGGPTTVNFTDDDGTVSSISVKGGGTAAVIFDGTGLSETPAKGKTTITGAPAGIASIAITGGSASTSVTINAKGGSDNAVDLGGLTADSALKSISGKQTILSGAINVAGLLSKLDLGLLNGAGVTLGGTATDKPVTITLAISNGGSITSGAPIKSLTGGSFAPGQSAAGTITAPALDKLTSKSDFSQDTNISGAIKSVSIARNMGGALRADTIGSVSIKGDVNGAAITSRRAFADGEKPLGKVTIGGALTNTIISASGNITSISAASSKTVTIFAGINPAADATAVPSQATDFASPATIGSVTFKASTEDTIIGASNINKATLGAVTVANSGNPLGLGADSIGAVSGTINGKKFSLKKLEGASDVQDQTVDLTLQDFQINVI